MISFANTLRNLRKGHNLTQSEVADIIGVDRSTYAYYERGATKPDFECILKLCKMYNIEVNDITKMFLNDDNTKVTFRTIDLDEVDKEIYLSDLDFLNVDEYERLMLVFYRQLSEPLKKLFFVKVKQSYDEISNMTPEE